MWPPGSGTRVFVVFVCIASVSAQPLAAVRSVGEGVACYVVVAGAIVALDEWAVTPKRLAVLLLVTAMLAAVQWWSGG
jgi:hypothetical protein